jgi:hypothetical protein
MVDRIDLYSDAFSRLTHKNKSDLIWSGKFRARDLKHLQGTMICAYPVSNIIPTISDSEGDYGKWMSDLLELYDGVIFARKFWTGVAFLLG